MAIQSSESGAIEYLRAQADLYGGKALIVGKGPSAAELCLQTTGGDRLVIGLNEVSLRIPCHAAFVIDEDILLRSGEQFATRGLSALIVPRVMHRPKQVGGLSLYLPFTAGTDEPSWQRALEGRVKRFNLSTAPAQAELGEPVQAYNFSAPTLAHLLALAGFTDIRLAGVDGGTQYAPHFGDLEFKKLRSIQDSFDAQFADLRQVRNRFGVEFSSIRSPRAHVLIGSELEQCLATEVLRWSIDSRSFLKVHYVEAGQVGRDLYPEGHSGTPFSFQRLYLPERSGHLGRGLYFDSDMLVFRDVYELFNWDMGDRVVLGCSPMADRQPQYSVYLVDNQRAQWDADEILAEFRAGRLSYDWIIGHFGFVEARAFDLPEHWNSLEVYAPNRTSNLHYTDMGTQPWLSVYNRHADLWCEALLQAVRQRAEVREALERSLDRGWVRPSLGWQVEHQHTNPWTLPRAVRALDRDWLPPHIEVRSGLTPRALQAVRWRVAARVRRALHSRGYAKLLRARTALKRLF